MIKTFLDVANLSRNCGTVRNVKRHMANQNRDAILQLWTDLLNRRAIGSVRRIQAAFAVSSARFIFSWLGLYVDWRTDLGVRHS